MLDYNASINNFPCQNQIKYRDICKILPRVAITIIILNYIICFQQTNVQNSDAN